MTRQPTAPESCATIRHPSILPSINLSLTCSFYKHHTRIWLSVVTMMSTICEQLYIFDCFHKILDILFICMNFIASCSNQEHTQHLPNYLIECWFAADKMITLPPPWFTCCLVMSFCLSLSVEKDEFVEVRFLCSWEWRGIKFFSGLSYISIRIWF